MSSAARFAVFLGIVLSIWALQHLYVGSRLLSLPLLQSTAARRALLALMVAGFLAYFLGRIAGAHSAFGLAAVLEYLGGLWMGTVFLLMAAFLVVDLVTLGGFVLKDWVPSLRTAVALLALAAALVAWVGGLRAPRVIELDLESATLPEASSGLRVLQVSDLHLGVMAGRGRVAGAGPS